MQFFLKKVCEKTGSKTSKAKTTNAQTAIHIHSKMSLRVLAFTTPGVGVTNNQ
jgi:hypothetical protein